MKKILILLSLFISNQLFAKNAIHGMVIFGNETLHAYHLPMFHAPHNKQVVFNFEVTPEVKKKMAELSNKNFLTFVPEPFDLEKFIAKPFSLKGDLYSGHFEKDGVRVLTQIVLSSPQIEFLQNLTQPGTFEKFNLIKSGSAVYAFHNLEGGTARDQIAKLSIVHGAFNPLSTAFTVDELLKIGEEHSTKGLCTRVSCDDVTLKVEKIIFEDEVM